MNLSQIELLRTLHENGFNLSKAADSMHIVQSAVSRQLHLFEEELGSPLLTRNGKKLTGLTELGQKILAQALTIQQAKKNIQSLATEYRNGDSGILHVATTHTQAKYFLPKPIQRFRAKYPAVKVYIVQSSPDHLIDFLHKDLADLAICTEKVADDETLIINPCYEWHHAVVIPKEHPLASGDLTLERLASFPILTYSLGFTGRSNIEKAFNDRELQMDVVLAAADTDIIKTYVRLGLGVGLIASMAYDPVVDSDLVVRNLPGLIPSSMTKIAYLRQNYLPAYSRHFIEELLDAAQEMSA